MTDGETLQLPNAAPDHLLIGLLPWEDRDAFHALFRDYCAEFVPAGPAETRLVEQLVWIDWRQRRLRIGERALHMATLDRNTSPERNDRLTRRALAHLDAGRPDTSSSKAIRSDDAEDADETHDWEQMLEAAEKAESVLLGRHQAGYDEALAILPEDTQEWFLETAEDEYTRYAANADGLMGFLMLEILPFFRNNLMGRRAGPAIRLQAWGESLDPDRIDRLMVLDERLGRQFEKAMAQLTTLQERRRKRSNSGMR